MKERVELFRLRAIRASGVACRHQETLCGAVCKSHQCSSCFSVFMQQKCDFEGNFCLIWTLIGPNSSLSCPLSIAHTHTLTLTLTLSHTHTHTLTHSRQTVDVHQKLTGSTKIELLKPVCGQFWRDWVYIDFNTPFQYIISLVR